MGDDAGDMLRRGATAAADDVDAEFADELGQRRRAIGSGSMG